MTLNLTGFIPIPAGTRPGFDHGDVFNDHPGSQRIYVAHTGADRIDVVDCQTDCYLRSIPDLPGVAGVLIDSEQDLLFSSDRRCARVSIFRCSDESLLGQVTVGSHPNGLAFDPTRQRLTAFNLGDPPGVDCTASVVALEGMEVVATMPLPGRPRWAQYDDATDRIYANIQDPAVVAVIDAGRLRIVATFSVPAAGPHGMGLVGNHLFCAADGNALVVLEKDSGAVVCSLDLPGVPDVVMVDPQLAHLYVAIGDPGVVCVFDTGHLAPLGTVSTEYGAHTLALNPTQHTVYVFQPQSSGAAVFVDSA
jgi:DNA-binding beta-propeller fold protein YncE